MRILVNAVTDNGIRKKINQDSILIKTAKVEESLISLAVVCDGVGGLDKGEVASAFIVKKFEYWFNSILKKRFYFYDLNNYKIEFINILKDVNEKLLKHQKFNGETLASTCSIFFSIDNRYIIVHVGDTRIYEITTSNITILTRDHVEKINDQNTHALYQCIGFNNSFVPDTLEGIIDQNVVFLLCSDGFRNLLRKNYIFDKYNPNIVEDAKYIKDISVEIFEKIKKEGELDNITVGCLKFVLVD